MLRRNAHQESFRGFLSNCGVVYSDVLNHDNTERSPKVEDDELNHSVRASGENKYGGEREETERVQ